jgi:glycosyltransferase involved in cell wall biosynthesis
MLDISVIILTFNEEQHIKRCLENVNQFAKKVYVIDSFSTDNTVAIAESMGATVIQHKWPGNQAEQFNWALKNIEIDTEWIFRLDADEYLLPELIEELQAKVPLLDENITGITFKRRHIFLGRWMKRGTYPVMILRMFRTGKAVCEQRLMDEHIELLEGENITFEHDFVDENLNNLSWWAQKHVGYAVREAAELLDIEYNITGNNSGERHLSEKTLQKRKLKLKYAKKPLFWRSFAYFIYRYFFKLGFLEGKEGFLWSFMQGWWYRTLVDAKVFEIKKACGNDKGKIIAHLKEHYNIVL